jgi:putative redox protein
MSIRVTFPGNMKVDAEVNGYTIHSDQRINAGGDGTAASPYEIFLSTIGLCAGAYVNGFCMSRGISTEGIEIIQDMQYDPIRQKMSKIVLDVKVPSDFPEKYYSGLVKSVELCAVKKTMQDPPEFEVFTSVQDSVLV